MSREFDRERGKVSPADEKRRVSVLAKLLRAELREARFSVIHLARTDIEFVPGAYGGMTNTSFDRTSVKKVDARGLKALHDAGAWKQDLLRFDIEVEALPLGTGRAAKNRTEFEFLLNDIELLCDGHVGHALGPVLRSRYRNTSVGRDSRDKSVAVSETVDLWSYLLVDACLGTPRRTAAKVLRWACGAPLVFEMRVLLGRLNAASSFALANGLAAERLPRRTNQLDRWLPIKSGIALPDYLDRTMLRIPCRIAPVLSKPTKVTEHRDGSSVVSWETSANIETTWPLLIGGVDELTHALSLVCDVGVETPMIWTDYGDHAHFGRRYESHSTGSEGPIPRIATESTLTADNLKEAIRLQPELCKPPDDVETALQYWLKSKAHRPDDADRLVFLRTALEALFLDRGNRAELTFRLATNGAWYTGRNRAERRQRYDVLKKVYAAASGAVHAGRVKSAGAGLLKDGQEICRLAILKRLRSKQVPVWDDIVFGR